MKKILITQRLIDNQDYNEMRDALDVNWAKFFAALDYLPLILPTFYNYKMYINDIDISGILLTGGNDLSSVSDSPLSRIRDDHEKELIKYSIDNMIPLVGICRGMQLIAEYFGALLKKVTGHAGTEHEIRSSGSSRFSNILSKIRTVNSYHNYAIMDPPDDFIAAARSGDNIIEAMEHKSLDISCIMWHPERMRVFSNADMELMIQFFEKRI